VSRATPCGLVLLVLAPWWACSGSNAGEVRQRAEAVGTALCASDGTAARIPGLIRIGDGLRQRLSDLHGQLLTDCAVEVRGDDAPGALGDGRASHHLLLQSEGAEVLGVRLRWDRGRGAFHVVGFWAPPSQATAGGSGRVPQNPVAPRAGDQRSP
jgi:hypothetical protein